MELISTIIYVLLFLLALSFIVFLHELGHFIAAKAVGIRATQFAVGFGHAVVSFRKGIGVRIGSTEKEYERRIRAYLAEKQGHTAGDDDHESEVLETVEGVDVKTTEEQPFTDQQMTDAEQALGLGETEYRFNWMPLGGYVKMLGQEDLDPAARSEHPRSFNSKPIWARFVVISAGVVMNLITAVPLFIGAFMIGVEFPPPVVGDVVPGSPAATTPAVDRPEYVGLQPGDRILEVDEEPIVDFTELALASALGDPEGLNVVAERPGLDGLLTFRMKPQVHAETKMLSIGVEPPIDNVLFLGDSPTFEKYDLKPGSRLLAVDDQPIKGFFEYARVVEQSEGQPQTLTFAAEDEDTETYQVTIAPNTELMPAGAGREGVSHLLGLVPVTRVDGVIDDKPADGKLREGDLLAQVGDQVWPDVPTLQRLVRAARGPLTFKVLGADGQMRTETITPDDGAVGIALTPAYDSARISGVIAKIPVPTDPTGEPLATEDAQTSSESTEVADAEPEPVPATAPAADEPPTIAAPFAELELAKGSQILSINEQPVQTFGDIRLALEAAGPSPITIRYSVPVPAGQTAEGQFELTPLQHQAVAQLDWVSPIAQLFRPLNTLQKADDPIAAAGMGFERSWMFAKQQYLTIGRMIQGTVPVDQASGPVMITAAGSRFAQRGAGYLLWFMGLISVALAVMNFLPIPVVDGGHAVLLIIEKIRGKPLPANVQGAIMMAGILMFLFIFLYVTYNDIIRLTGM